MLYKLYENVLNGKTRANEDNYVLHLMYKETIAHVFL
jgi:hypothetical protein